MTASGDRPIVALAMGDPAGISPELTARLLASSAGATAGDR
jgi:4-hydroxythreonine-4-phosphate dehydrogenase